MSRRHLGPGASVKSPHSSSLRSSLVAASWLVLASMACSNSPEDRLEEARRLQSDNQMEESLPILIELIESGSRQGEVLYRYGRALSLTGHASRSVWALDAAREDPDWFVSASQQLALDAHRGGNYKFAMDVFQRLHEEAPEAIDEDLMGLLLEARVLLDSQDHFEQALELIDSILERFPEEETAVRMKAVALLGLRRPDEAYEILRAANVSPEKAAKGDGAPGEASPDEVSEPGPGESAAKKAAGETGEDEASDPGLYAELEDDSSEAYWCSVRVSFKREAGQLDEAGRIADECLVKYPADVGLVGQSIKVDTDRGDFERILRTLETAFEKRPTDPQIRGAVIQYYERVGRIKDVERILRKTIDDARAAGQDGSPEMAAHWVALAGFLLEQDRVGEALVAFDSANKIIGDNATPDLLLREAEALIRGKEYEQALALAEKTPVEVHRAMLRGRIAFEQGHYQEALDELGKAALLWPDNAPTRFYRARAAEGVGDFDLAIEEYRQAIRSDPALAPARERLAKLHLAEGNVREASAILTFESPRKPTTPSVESELLMVEVETRRGTEPDVDIAPTPDYPLDKLRRDTVRALGRGLSVRANAKVAAGVLAELEKASPPPLRGSFLRERVSLLVSAGELDVALREANAGFESLPGDLDAAVALGIALAGKGSELDRATKILKGVVEKRPDDAAAWTALGDVDKRRKSTSEAVADYERALKFEPDHWAALRPLLESLDEAGKTDDAMRRLETFVTVDAPYDHRGALELARRLPEGDETREWRIRLARQAVRFGGGAPALELLAKLDPSAVRKVERPVEGETSSEEVESNPAGPDVDASAKTTPKSPSPAVDSSGRDAS